MIQPSTFAQSYLTLQGVEILPAPRVKSAPIRTRREPEFVPVVPEYERGI